jgi:hypothetical protein
VDEHAIAHDSAAAKAATESACDDAKEASRGPTSPRRRTFSKRSSICWPGRAI